MPQDWVGESENHRISSTHRIWFQGSTVILHWLALLLILSVPVHPSFLASHLSKLPILNQDSRSLMHHSYLATTSKSKTQQDLELRWCEPSDFGYPRYECDLGSSHLFLLGTLRLEGWGGIMF